MTPGTTLVLLGFGLGALVVASQRNDRGSHRSIADDATLRARAIEAQQISARASQRARELAALWSERNYGNRETPTMLDGQQEQS